MSREQHLRTDTYLVSILVWRLTLAIAAAIPAVGLLLLLILALGAADPPHTARLQWQAGKPQDWPQEQINSDLLLDHALGTLPTVFTLELNVQNSGAADSAWGIALTSDLPTLVLIDNQGYFSLESGYIPHWREFSPIRPGQNNSLSLSIADSREATVRINEEIAWTGHIAAGATWAVAYFRAPVITWRALAYYTP
jgi:hypothetical protein